MEGKDARLIYQGIQNNTRAIEDQTRALVKLTKIVEKNTRPMTLVQNNIPPSTKE